MGDVVKPEELPSTAKAVASGVPSKASGNPPRSTTTRRGRGGSSADKGTSAARREVTYHDCTFNISGITPEMACALLNTNAPRKKPSTPRAKKQRGAAVDRASDTTSVLTKMCDDLLRDAEDCPSPPYGNSPSPHDQGIKDRNETSAGKRRSASPSIADEYEVLADGVIQTQQPSSRPDG